MSQTETSTAGSHPRIPAQPNSLNLLPAQMFVVQPLRATHRVSGYASGGT
ncbi:Uncharacterised protein [Mycobacteroides abscessus subsp. abscessus]|nr:Uncharacterised protein [Mycobacteroides abscessus subsp. abscessus]